MEISGIEAHLLLHAVDRYLAVDRDGRVTVCPHGYDRATLQALRDRLFAAHEHPPWDEPKFYHELER